MWVAEMKHNSGCDATLAVRSTRQEATRRVHAFFLSYDMELRDGRAFDPGSDDGEGRGFDVFDGVEYVTVDGEVMVSAFMHAGGDGPCARVVESED